MTAMICDFCAAPGPPHTIECISFDVDDPAHLHLTPMKSTGAFMACDVCNSIIVLERREELLLRAKRCFIKRNGFWHPDADKILRGFHDQFWAARIRVV